MSRTTNLLLAAICALLVAVVVLLAVPRKKPCDAEYSFQSVPSERVKAVKEKFAVEGWFVEAESAENGLGHKMLTFKRCR